MSLLLSGHVHELPHSENTVNVCMRVLIPCGVAESVSHLEGPLAASAHRQRLPAAAEHPVEGDTHMP